jgi:hypothetical protein
MNELVMGVNWLAVGIGTIAAFTLGALWYSPILFVNGWAKGVGIDIEDKPDNMIGAMTAQLMATFLLSFTIGVCAVGDQFALAVLVILTMAILLYAGGSYSQKSTYAKMVEAGFVVVMGIVMIVCHILL